MRATFITTALENGAQLKDVQKAPAIVIPARQNCTIGSAIIPIGPRRSSRPTDSSVLTAAQLRARRFDFVDNPELPVLAAHHTICWEIRACKRRRRQLSGLRNWPRKASKAVA